MKAKMRPIRRLKTFRQMSEIGRTRGLGGGSAALKDFVRLPSSQAPHRVDRRKVLRAGTHPALFPVVDGLRRRADQKAAFGGRQAQALSLACHAPGAEASAFSDGFVVRRDWLRRASALPCPPKLAFELSHPALQRRDLQAVARGGFPERGGLAADLLPRNAGDFVLESSCNVRHRGARANGSAS
jgi:hypothetical protein